MRILFLHDNFPAQFGAYGQYLAGRGWEVWFGTQRKNAALKGVNVFNYQPHRDVGGKAHPYTAGFEKSVINGQAFARAALTLKKKGFSPDIVMAHSGWGPGMFAKDVWPDAKHVGYFEWYYRSDSPDIAFMNAGERTIDDDLRARVRNASILVDLAGCDAALSPTRFQKEQFPACFADKMRVMHDGIDTGTYKPAPGATLRLPGLDLSAAPELITYVARGMEPYRGFPEFMSALEVVLAERPQAHVVIVGEDRVAYGKKLPQGDSYKKRALAENRLDWSRVHFTGLLPRHQYLQVLQASSVHLYLTVPFVLSWSMMEAMSAGCAIVASDAAPVSELSDHDAEALRLVDMKSREDIARAVIELLSDREKAAIMGARARAVIVKHYAAEDLFERKTAWLTSLVQTGAT